MPFLKIIAQSLLVIDDASSAISRRSAAPAGRDVRCYVRTPKTAESLIADIRRMDAVAQKRRVILSEVIRRERFGIENRHAIGQGRERVSIGDQTPAILHAQVSARRRLKRR